MLAPLLARRPAASIDEVVSLMTAIDQALPDSDGVKWFNRLYLEVTLAVRRAVAGGGGPALRDPRFLGELDVVFANLFFDAAAAGDVNPSAAPPAWRPLFESRHLPRRLRLQFALAGMNAHINRDLPMAVIQTYRRMGGTPTLTDPRHADFEQVNGILEAVQAQVKGTFAVGLVEVLDVAAGDLDDLLAMWSIRAARDAAWTHAEVLWSLGASPVLRDAFFGRLDRMTGLAGRGLLVPLA